MRRFRPFPAALASVLALAPALALASVLALPVALGGDVPARAQTVDEAEEGAAAAERKAEAASGLVGEAVAERDEIERQLTETIAAANDIAAQLSAAGAALDRTAGQLRHAADELDGIGRQIEAQAVDAYMTVLSSPTVNLFNSASVEEAIIAGAVVEDVVAAGQESVDQLVVKRRNLEELQQTHLAQQSEFLARRDELDAEVGRVADLYGRADDAVADAVREAQHAEAAHREALSAVDLARAREDERRRQEERARRATEPPQGGAPTPESGDPTPEGAAPPPSDRAWDHPPKVERWRPLVAAWFPANRVEEALRILDCESHGNPDAYSPYSGTSGLFQFLPGTWAGAAPSAGWAGHSVFDPEANISVAAWLTNRYQELGKGYWTAWGCRRRLG